MELVTLETRYGYRFSMPHGLIGSQEEEIATTGVYEPATSEALFKLVKPGMKVMDCGSNCGFHALNLAKAVGPTGRVYCMEANPELIDVLRRNVDDNGFADRVEIFNQGVWKEDGKLSFPLRTRSLGGAGFKKKSRNPLRNFRARKKVKAWVDVDVISLATFCGTREIDLIRMDIEGAEFEAIDGARALLKTRSIALVMECLPKNSTQKDISALYEMLRSLGYFVYRITNAGWLRIDSGKDLFEKHEDAWRHGQRDVLCEKRDLGPVVS